ncbi:unnamed protein product [Polarella glacialis]|uniref:CRAL-TRIO domain-containing protein n=1 Tax=Polarella glacialis TaxID=89957 RepID=A0A813EMW6_POLGL|nr:unnamed protein product [Polarella glacialis]
MAAAGLEDHFCGHDTINGPDVDGRPVMISRYGGMDNERVFGDVDAFVKYRLAIMEKTMARLSFTKAASEDLCQVHDYSGVPLLFKTSEVKAGVTAMTKVFGDHYPETKGKTIFVNFPAVFSKLFQAFSVFIPERTRKKFIILSETDHEVLFQHISPELVPVALGGMFVESPATQLPGVPCQVVSVPARSKAEVVLAELNGPATVSWELRVCSSEVSYEVVFCPTNSEAEKQDQLVAGSTRGKPLLSSDGVVSGSYRGKEAGTLRCRFNNDTAWLRSRLCICRAELSDHSA